MSALSTTHHFIQHTRRLGAMVAFEVIDPQTGKPDKALTANIVKVANEQGLLLLSAGIKGNVIRFLTPLVITDEELTRGFDILTAALNEVTSTQQV